MPVSQISGTVPISLPGIPTTITLAVLHDVSSPAGWRRMAPAVFWFSSVLYYKCQDSRAKRCGMLGCGYWRHLPAFGWSLAHPSLESTSLGALS